ncbi:MAG TPA: hypothetical protein VG796_23565 [Verrucomicrobiales bacterium]|nr:hypothetical protein [Verrucomicrobiales bacterium]
MALAKRGTRKVTVNGTRYCWKVAAPYEPDMKLVVQRDGSSRGQRMVTMIGDYPWHGTIISPWLVRRTILRALAAGWLPNLPGPELVFHLAGRFEKGDYLPFRMIVPMNPPTERQRRRFQLKPAGK